MQKIDLSVVIPVYNEEELLGELKERLIAVLNKLKLNYEVIFADDASSDCSLSMLEEFSKDDPRIRVLSFTRNFGHQTAITAGLNFAKGSCVMVLDGDLQDPPEIIPNFMAKWKEGFDVVYGIRKKRKDNFLKKVFCNMYYRLLKLLANTDIALDSGDCCLMDKKVVAILNNMPERNRFVRGLRRWVGFKQTGLEYDRDKRYAGKSKYTLFKLLKLGLDGIFSFSETPLKISIFVGFFIALVSLAYAFWMAINRIFSPTNQIPGWTSIVAAVTFLGGIELMVMGFLGEYILRIYDEVKARPLYLLNRVIGFEDKDVSGISNYPRS